MQGGGDEDKRTPPMHDPFWYGDDPVGGEAAGVSVTPDSAMRTSAVLACVRVIAETVAMTPLHVYRLLRDGGRERAGEHPLHSILHDQPNRYQTAFEFWEMMTGHVCLRGNAYAEIVPGLRGSVDQLVPRHPDRMRPMRLDDGRVVYEHRPLDGERRILLPEEVFHLRWFSLDGLTGLSPIALARQSIGLAIATETYGAKLFQNGALPGKIVLRHPNKLKGDAATNLRRSFHGVHTGSKNWHRVIVLEEGMEAQELGMSNEDAQFLEARQFQIVDIARFYRVPPHLIGDLSRSTNNNIEHQSLEFAIYTMLPWFRRYEQAIRRDLITDTATYFAEFLLSFLLRGDIKSRYEAFRMAILDGWMTRNEVRRLENLNAQPGLDRFLMPLNMSVVGSDGLAMLAEEPQNDEPPTDRTTSESGLDTGPVLALLAEDAADRIVRAELREWTRRHAKAADDRGRFLAWAEQFYAVEHRGYIERAIAPVVGAAAILLGRPIPAPPLADGLAGFCRANEPTADDTPENPQGRCALLAARILEVLTHA